MLDDMWKASLLASVRQLRANMLAKYGKLCMIPVVSLMEQVMDERLKTDVRSAVGHLKTEDLRFFIDEFFALEMAARGEQDQEIRGTGFTAPSPAEISRVVEAANRACAPESKGPDQARNEDRPADPSPAPNSGRRKRSTPRQ